MTRLKSFLPICLVLLLAACGGGGLSGKYTDAGGIWTFTFHSNGTVEVQSFTGQLATAHYKIDGARVILSADGQPSLVLQRNASRQLFLAGLPLTQRD